MKSDLIERYIYAVTKRMDRKQRQDVSMELQGLIEDMLTERCGSRTPEEKDVRVVLTELGTPQELYSQYCDDADACLIGQPYYSTYMFVMKIVLAAVAVGITISNVILQLQEPKIWWEMIGTWLDMLYNSALASFTIVTLLFAFFYRKGIRIAEPFSFDNLPPVPKKKQEIPRIEAMIGIGIDVLFLVVFLATPQVLGMYALETGEIIPIFNVDAIRAGWYIILLFGILGIVRETVKLLEGRYNRKVLTVALMTDLLSAILAVIWLSDSKMFNPVFTQRILAEVAGQEAVIVGLFENFPKFILGLMLFALVLDSVDVTYKTLRK